MIEQNRLDQIFRVRESGRAFRPRRTEGVLTEIPDPRVPAGAKRLSNPKSLQGISMPTTIGDSNLLTQEPLVPRELSDFVYFRRDASEVIINEHGAYVPRSLFGQNVELGSDLSRSSDGRVTVTIFAHSPIGNRTNISRTEPTNCEQEMRWIAEHGREYAGQWVALIGDRLLHHGETAREVYEAIRNMNVRLPLVLRIESPDELPFGGW